MSSFDKMLAVIVFALGFSFAASDVLVDRHGDQLHHRFDSRHLAGMRAAELNVADASRSESCDHVIDRPMFNA
tara:strand:+ start:121 stop:339 length:219 start_codon:yes stop_codon:yes gene_type:complete